MPAQVDTIVVSHFHGDHIGGIRGKDGTLAFPNAKVMVPEAEWAFWMDDGQMSRAPEAMQPGFQNVRRVFAPMADEVERFTDGQELVPGLRVVAAPGHTPGHSAFLVSDGDDRLLVWSDTTNKPELFVRQSDLARGVRHGRRAGRGDPPAAAGHGCGRAAAGRGLPFPVPRHRLHRPRGTATRMCRCSGRRTYRIKASGRRSDVSSDPG